MTADLIASTGFALIMAALPVMLAWLRNRHSVLLDVLSDALLLAGNLLLGAGMLMQGDPYSAINFAAAAFIAWNMWRRWKRRRRDRAPRSYGAKSRALLAALVRKVRESATPRPVLRPVPGAAG